MIIGEKDSFAIQFEVNPKPDRWLFGHICFIINNIEIGDYYDETSLNTAVGYLKDLLWYTGIRNEPTLFQLDKVELFWKIDNALYGNSDISREEIMENCERFEKFHALSPGVDIFDKWKGYLIENKEQGRLIIRNPQEEINEYFIKAGEFDFVIKKLVYFFEQNYSQFGTGGK